VSRVANLLALGTAVALGGCSLIWTPVTYDAAVEPPDAWEAPDADLDAGVDAPELDAGVDAPDAFVPPPEECALPGDEDGDGYSDCNDPDCFGADTCCRADRGTELNATFNSTSTPGNWVSASWSARPTTGRTYFQFTAAPGTVYREVCVPLAQGARIQFALSGGGAAPASFAFVLSPASRPGPSGFLDELAIRVDQAMAARITRAGVSLPLEADCRMASTDAGPEDTVALSGAMGSVITLDLRPGLSSGQAALLATVSVQNRGGPCGSTTVVASDLPILLADLVRTADGPGTCEDSPGLFVGFEGTGPETFALERASTMAPALEIRALECSSPGVFAPPGVSLEASDVASGSYGSGGIGAPSVGYDDTIDEWTILFDASAEERSTEVFRRLTTRIGMAGGTVIPPQTFPRTFDEATTSPVGLPLAPPTVNVREPSMRFETAGLSVVFAQESGAGLFDLVRGGITRTGAYRALPFPVAVHRGRQDAGPAQPDAGVLGAACDSLREPVAIAAYDDTSMPRREWVLGRCDVGSSSRLALFEIDPSSDTVRALSEDLLSDSTAGGRVLAVDAIVRPTGFLAVWVLAAGPDGLAELHLYVDERARRGVAPTLQPYAGNPVLRAGDPVLGECPPTSECRVTSFAVGIQDEVGPDRLRFLFAVSQTGTSVSHRLVAAEQIALDGLDNGR